ncbi:MAG: tripartite tricarboxylate transporter substrate binding protein [Burkholderiales bacterium]|nr:tripartite tricarboxylate transporter substrate binding protein [Burkholderiales bacterium]
MRTRTLGGLALLALALPGGGAWAQSYPTRPVRFIVPWPAGGVADITTRLFGRKLTELMGQQFVVENRPGATGMIGCELVARAAPDGYTLLMATTTTHATNPVMYKKLPYDPVRDFAPISLVADAPFVLVVHPSLQVKSVKALIALAKARPGQLTFGSSGTGGSAHLGFELFNAMAGITAVHVPYKGLAPATVDLLAGNITMSWESTAAATPHIRSGRLRGLGIGSAKRSPLMPDVATIAETLPGFELGSWSAMFAPAGTPAEIIRRLQREVSAAVKDVAMREQLAALGAEGVAGTPEELAAVLKSDVVKWARIARQANLRPE